MVTPTSLNDLGQEFEVSPTRTRISVEEATSYHSQCPQRSPHPPYITTWLDQTRKWKIKEAREFSDCCTGSSSAILVQSDRFIFAVICLRAYNVEVWYVKDRWTSCRTRPSMSNSQLSFTVKILKQLPIAVQCNFLSALSCCWQGNWKHPLKLRSLLSLMATFPD